MLKKLGYSILEVMIALLLISALGAGLYRLEVSQMTASHQAINKSVVTLLTNNLFSQMLTHLNFIGSSYSLASTPGYSSSCSNDSCYVETNYSAHTASGSPSSSSSGCCTASDCNDSAYAACALSNWKRDLSALSVTGGNIWAIACKDSSLSIPTTSSPNCDGNGSLVLKVLWQNSNHSESSLLTNKNYLILKAPAR